MAGRQIETGVSAPTLRRGLSFWLVAGLFIISGAINLLYLGGSWFMLEVYDRVLPSRGYATLAGLLAIVLALYAFQAMLEIVRSRVLVRAGALFSETIGPVIFRMGMERQAHASEGELAEQLQDVETVRRFITGAGPAAVLDIPWMPVYLLICFMFHPWIGAAAVAGAVTLVVLTLASDRMSSAALARARAPERQRSEVLGNGLRAAHVVHAMGMRERILARWVDANSAAAIENQRAADATGGLGSVAKVFRMALQSLVLAIGALLVISDQATAGVMIASSILTARALAPVEQIIAHWRSLIGLRQSWRRLDGVLATAAASSPRTRIPLPHNSLEVRELSCAAPGQTAPYLRDINFALNRGDGLAVVGNSGSGKSTLVKALLGLWPANAGSIRLDGATLDQWSNEDLGRAIGYLPQETELLAGTIAQNIARFDPHATSADIVRAAEAADVHQLIVSLPQGYETPVGPGGGRLSAGQRQRIGLARALFGEPFLLVLDEPNANLDADGERALARAIMTCRRRGGIVIVVAHRPGTLAALETVLVLNNGRQHAFGPKDEILAQVLQPSETPDARNAAGWSGRSAERKAS